MTLTIDSRFRGPSSSGNGGYVAGLIAEYGASPVVTVTLRQPPPLDMTLDVQRDDDTVRLTTGAEVVAEAVPGEPDTLVTVPPVELEAALRAAEVYAGWHKHPFPECFVCGPSRTAGDGMRLSPGRVEPGRTACAWEVAPDLAGESPFVWAALDCPGGWTAPIEGRPMVLGRMTAQVMATPTAGETCVVTGRMLGTEGRKTWTATTVYGSTGAVLGRAHATWIAVPT